MAQPDYSLPAWVNKDPSQIFNRALENSRASAQRQQEIGDQEGHTQFQEGLDEQTADQQAQLFDERKKAAAMQLLDMQGYKHDITPVDQGGLGLPPTQAILRHPTLVSRLPSSAFAQPKPGATSVTPIMPRSVPNIVPTQDPWGGRIPNIGGEPNVPNVSTPSVGPPAPQFDANKFAETFGKGQIQPASSGPALKPVTDPTTGKLIPGAYWIPNAKGDGFRIEKIGEPKDSNLALLETEEKASRAAAAKAGNTDPNLNRAAVLAQSRLKEYRDSKTDEAEAKPEATNSKYTAPVDVKNAVKAGTLSKEDAAKILQSQFGFEP